ncbi:BamA/TamA family outer membrane protein [Membranicola marinus]|uniref:BamA/TamA family outer membrane protein n=1 Tax=Membranihabitans marinus TaxID=1227546 RepID=A0A953LAK3_9BACT|nr:BamA/TamA family outer membrane protein [Membranihabitans marinus]MBY5958798.1 BamA/TamA family outer membrane protein [Membranihabitans marinus]
MKSKKAAIYSCLLLFGGLFMLSSCNVTKFLAEDEYLLSDYAININGPVASRQKKILENEIYYLDTLQRIENRNWRIWLYYKYQDADTGTLNHFFYEQAATRPSIYKQGHGGQASDVIKRYVMDKGYYDAQVFFSDQIKKRKATISYTINTGPLYTIASKKVSYPNETIKRLIENRNDESFLKRNDVLSLQAYEKEKNRIASIMQNNGYPYFTSLNISKRPQAIKLADQIDLYFEILNDADSIGLRRYRFGDIVVDHNYNPFAFEPASDTATIDAIQHLNFDKEKSLNRQVMNQSIPFRNGDLFSAEALEKARQNIVRYNIYSSVVVQRIPSPEDPNVLNIYFILQPSKKYEFKVDFDLNNTEYSSRSSLLGVSVGPELSNRNTFGGGETYTMGLQFQTEFNPFGQSDTTERSTVQTFIAGFRNNLIMPRFVDYFKMYELLSGVSPDFYSILQSNGISTIDLNYEYVYTDQLYKYHSFLWQAGNNFNWAAGRNNLRVNNLSLNVFLPDLFPSFIEEIKDRQFVRKSLDPQIFTSLLFSNAQFTHVGRKDYAQRQFSFYGSMEFSGLEILAANAITNGFRDTFQLFNKFDFAKYFKVDLDGRFLKDLSATTSFASRLNIGIATPLTGSVSVPFVKQFFVGGPSSMRAWRIRELGPGSLQDSTALSGTNQPYANVGDLKIEMNAEYRFPLFWRLNSALFLDVGNIWILGKSDQPESRFTSDFWKEFAVGTGTGIRMDLTFFTLRLDWGIKLKLPYRQDNGSYWAYSSFGQYLKKSNLNLAISMPF